VAKKEDVTAKVIFEECCGPGFDLAQLGAEFEADDWQTESSLMAKQFKMMGIWDVEIGPWASGNGAATKVKGKVRSMQCVQPLPPNPMCPASTRYTAMYHVLATPAKVVLEKIITTHDVPYGDYFNILVCDTFTVNVKTRNVMLHRSFGLEWLKSTWLKKTIESGSLAPVKADAEKCVELIKAHFQELAPNGREPVEVANAMEAERRGSGATVQEPPESPES